MISRRALRYAIPLLAVFVAFGLSQTAALAVDAPRAAAELTPSAEPTVAPLPVIRMQDDDLSVRFGGTWTSKWRWGSSGQTDRVSPRTGAYALASFEGTGVAFVSRRGPDMGKARIYIDGVATATVDLYASSLQKSCVVWRAPDLTNGVHSIKVVVLGTKRAASRGAYVVVDAYEVTGAKRAAPLPGSLVNNGNSKLVRIGSWWASSRTAAFGGSSWRSRTKGSSVTIRFKGTGFTWVGRKDAQSGKAEILLDGRSVGVVSQFATVGAERRVAWSATGLPDGVHNITVRTLGVDGTSGGDSRIDVDGFFINGTLLQAYRPTPFKYPWRTYIVIDKSQFRLYWVKNGLLIKAYPIAHGKANTPTPSRVWRIDSKYYTDPSSVYGPRKMRLYKQVATSNGYRYEYTRYAIHGTNEPWVIGTQASHGCIRMYNRDVLELWPQVPLGTMVVTRD